MDNVDKETRSRIMSLVRSRHNRSTEQRFRNYLIRAGLKGWRSHPPDVAGIPDFAFKPFKVAIFIDGCFWHGCRRHLRRPKSNIDYWQKKIDGNMARDRKRRAMLRRLGWRVFRIWEHEFQSSKQIARRITEINKAVKQAF